MISLVLGSVYVACWTSKIIYLRYRTCLGTFGWIENGFGRLKMEFFGSARRRPRSLAWRPRSLVEGFWVSQKHERDRGIRKSGDRGLSLFLAFCGVFEGFRYPEARG